MTLSPQQHFFLDLFDRSRPFPGHGARVNPPSALD